MKNKKWLMISLGAALLIALGIGIVSLVKGYFILAPSVQILPQGGAVQVVSAHSDYTAPKVTARKGNVDLSHLRRLAENLPSGLCPLEKRDKDLEKLGNMFSALADTISQSVNYNSSTAGLLERVAESIGKLTQKN